MALDARTRSSLYNKFREILGEHDANALMSEFPASDNDELVTKQFLRAEIAGLRTELHTEIGALRTELHDQVSGVRTELHTEIGALRSELADRLRHQTVFIVTSLFTAVGAAVGLARAFS
ncbi:MAG: hypothetical protein N2037_09390 [Acidimicrobiales bacterium]|nr:hypothetical protein [Acidimicrobiales bacterium]